MSALKRSLLAWAIRALTAPAAESPCQEGGFGFTCCGLTGGPWPTRSQAKELAAVHDHLHHGPHGGSVARVLPASALPARTSGAHSPSGVQITADSGMSVGGGQQ